MDYETKSHCKYLIPLHLILVVKYRKQILNGVFVLWHLFNKRCVELWRQPQLVEFWVGVFLAAGSLYLMIFKPFKIDGFDL